MMTYLVIGLSLFLLILVIYISAKPISMGIEARRNININTDDDKENTDDVLDNYEDERSNKISISEEITKLSELKNKGLISDEEYEKAKNKILN